MTDAATSPPYRIPPLAEIHARVGTNGLTVASTFSGCGGSCLGFEWAGYTVVAASEFVPAARETYRANHPGVPVDARDVRQATAASIRRLAGLPDDFEIDVLEGSPPCASFSTSGRREKLWGKVKKYSDTEQRVDDLFYEFARILRDLQPRAFVAENVPGLDIGVARERVLGTPQVGMFSDDHESTVLHTLIDCGYRVATHVLNAADFGVPQNRRRLIFVGFRRDLGIEPSFPEKLGTRYTIRDACPWIDRVVVDMSTSSYGDKNFEFEADDDAAPTITAGGVGARTHYHVRIAGDKTVDPETGRPVGEPDPTPEPETDISKYAIGGEWDKIGGVGASGKYFQLVRPDPDAPAPTITATAGSRGAASVVHPLEKRKFSVLEIKRLSGFPDDFVLTGTYTKKVERMGRAVPPPLMRAVAEHVARLLGERTPDEIERTRAVVAAGRAAAAATGADETDDTAETADGTSGNTIVDETGDETGETTAETVDDDAEDERINRIWDDMRRTLEERERENQEQNR